MSRLVLDLPHPNRTRYTDLPVLHTIIRVHDHSRFPIEVVLPGRSFGRRYTEREALIIATALEHAVERRRHERAARRVAS